MRGLDGVADSVGIQCALRVRPLLNGECGAPATAVNAEDGEVSLSIGADALHTFSIERHLLFGSTAAQEDVWSAMQPAVDTFLCGYNAAIMAYGQTGAGKTHTMLGSPGNAADGVIPRSVAHVFERIHALERGGKVRFDVRVSYLQIYNEALSDLLLPDIRGGGSKVLTVREDPRRRGIYVEGLSEVAVSSSAQALALLRSGTAARVTAATSANELSSRSHALFTLSVEQQCVTSGHSGSSSGSGGSGGSDSIGSAGSTDAQPPSTSSFRMAKLHLIDLAGSESARGGVSGQRLQECRKINASLSALSNVIHALSRAPTARDARGGLGRQGSGGSLSKGATPFGEAPTHVPYRDSKLTRLLQDCVGGNSVCTLIACVSSAASAASETLSTLKFAARARRVRNYARVNSGDKDPATLLLHCEQELHALRTQAASRDVQVQRRVAALEEGMRREHADKLAALRELEQRSIEVAHERRVRAALEARLSQTTGGSAGTAAREELEREEQGLEEETEQREEEGCDAAVVASAPSLPSALLDEAAVGAAERADLEADRLTALLHKQRDLILAMEARCCERDAAALSLSERLAGSQARERELEERLDGKVGELQRMERQLERQREAEAAAGRGHGAFELDDEHGGALADAAELRRQAKDFAKEREALTTILECQVSRALSRASSTLDAALHEGGGVASAAAAAATARDLRALEALVSRAVAALKMPGAPTRDRE